MHAQQNQSVEFGQSITDEAMVTKDKVQERWSGNYEVLICGAYSLVKMDGTLHRYPLGFNIQRPKSCIVNAAI